MQILGILTGVTSDEENEDVYRSICLPVDALKQSTGLLPNVPQCCMHFTMAFLHLLLKHDDLNKEILKLKVKFPNNVLHHTRTC